MFTFPFVALVVVVYFCFRKHLNGSKEQLGETVYEVTRAGHAHAKGFRQESEAEQLENEERLVKRLMALGLTEDEARSRLQ